jgi:hypothetical protein
VCLLTLHLHQQVAADSTNRAAPAATVTTHSVRCDSALSGGEGGGAEKFLSTVLSRIYSVYCLMFSLSRQATLNYRSEIVNIN